ncbi:MAG TPA: 3'(2'),5'-bisphosphate nucleotidase CysQ [Aliiroseovarius sp.]|nr:3'(2'),5'-bisphosphate nucleotidase CysQ [Aliiroseovarius sp.]
MPVADDLILLQEAARAAGDIALGFFKCDPEAWEKPDSAGPVTEADLAVDRMLREDLCAARPDYGWLSEETEDTPDRLSHDKVFVVDPIDGTRAFIEGSPTWAHSLAIVDRGQVTAAVVYLPVNDSLYAAQLGGGATLNDASIHVRETARLDDASLLAARPVFDAWNWRDGQVPTVKRQFRSSLAYRMSLVGEGRFDAMLTLRATWEWDVAAGALIVTEAGGRVTNRRLDALRFNNPGGQVNGVLAASPTIHNAIGARLSQA